MDADKMKVHYGRLTSNLLEWIKMKVAQLNDRNFPNSLEGIQKDLLAFKQYRTIEKPPKWVILMRNKLNIWNSIGKVAKAFYFWSFYCGHDLIHFIFLSRYKERSEIEALYFNINTQLKSLNQPAFTPTDGLLIHDLEKGWELLEAAEHKREVALRQELLRQERLEQLNYNFEKKVLHLVPFATYRYILFDFISISLALMTCDSRRAKFTHRLLYNSP